MALLAKIDGPLLPDAAGRVEIHARSFENPDLKQGQLVFIWISENSGGSGLQAHGSLERLSQRTYPNKIGHGEHEELVLIVRLDSTQVTQPLAMTQVGPYRDRGSALPIADISRVVYKHAHNKIVSIDQRCSDFLTTRFTQ